MREMAFLNAGPAHHACTDERGDEGSREVYEYRTRRASRDFVAPPERDQGAGPQPDHLRSRAEANAHSVGGRHAVELELQRAVSTFANTINTHEGGTHEEGFRAALTSTINRYARASSLLKEKDPATSAATTSARA